MTTRSHDRHQQRQEASRTMGPDDEVVVGADVAGSLRSSVAAVSAPGARAVPLASVSRAQQAVGNVGIQRLLAVQRWDLGVAPSASCSDVLTQISRRSPYKPEAAFTDARFRYKPELSVVGEGRKHTATVSSANVDADITVDMPEWKPDGAMARPWSKAWRALRDHEAKHEDVAERAKGTLRSGLESVSATRPTEPAAREAAEAAARAKWKALLAAYAKEQRLLDPYDVDLTRP
jgi:predicted secreted Zn-dependent protease